MKVNGPNNIGAPQAARGAARTAAGGFSISMGEEIGETSAASRAVGVSGVNSLDVLLALQGVGGPLERRRKAVRRAGVILDVLDDVKMALLDGGIAPAALERLVSAVRLERGEAGDEPRLQELLDEIETRASVELAKLEMARAAT